MKLTIKGLVDRHYEKVSSYDFRHIGNDYYFYVNGEKILRWPYTEAPYDVDYFSKEFGGYLNGNLPGGSVHRLHLFITFNEESIQITYESLEKRLNKFLNKLARL